MSNQFRKENKRSGVFTRRALLLGAGQIGILGALGAKLYQVQVVEGERYSTLAESNRISARLTAPPRGRVLDRFGIPIAGNKLNWRALLTVEQTDNVDETLDAFGRVVTLADHERARIEREMRKRRRFIPLVVREFLTWEEMAKLEVSAPIYRGSSSMWGRRGSIRTGRRWRMWWGTSRRRTTPTWPRIRCWRCRGSGWGGPEWRRRRTSSCGARPGRPRWRSTRSDG